MKKIKILLIAVFIGIISCDNALETVPTDFIAPEFYYNNENELNNALNGVYSVLRYVYSENLNIHFDVADEEYGQVGASNLMSNYNLNSTEKRVTATWKALYRGIEFANKLLENIDKANLNEDALNEIVGQAKFLRVYYYFILVSNWGDVPLKIKSTVSVSDTRYERTPSAEVFDFIIKEMEEAEQLVKPISDYNYAGRVTKSAVQGILARVYLYRAGFPENDPKGFENSLKWSQKIIASGLHSLNNDYSQVFINLIQDKYDLQESIWEVEFYYEGATDIYNNGSRLGVINGIPQTITALGYSASQLRPHGALFYKYEPTDSRRDWCIAPYSFQGNNANNPKVNWTSTQIFQRFIGKYRREYELTASKQNNYLPTNFPLLRYADVLLMAAEAENEINGPTSLAHEYLNQVRTRAKASLFTDANLITDKDSFRKILQDERSRELCFEGVRRMDLRRWGILISTMKENNDFISSNAPDATTKNNGMRPGLNIQEKHLYFPIPLQEISLDPLLTQNPGY